MLASSHSQMHARNSRSATPRSTLSQNQQRLVRCLQRLNFGVLRGLYVRDGDPQFDPPFQIVCTVKLPGAYAPRPEADIADFVLKHEVVSFLELLKHIGSGVIEVVKVQNGLPVLVDFAMDFAG